MASAIRPKKPTAARRNVKQETFSTAVSCARLRTVQKLLQKDDETTIGLDCPDAILAVDGVDSRYCGGCRELLNFLLFDFYSTRKQEIESCGQSEEIVEDLMMVIYSGRVHVYCNPINVNFILPYIMCWPNLRLHCLDDHKFSDEDVAEEFKVTSFINMVEDCHKVAIPYNACNQDRPFDKMVVEKWPIVQAYAVDSMGQHGFFTARHDVIDFSQTLARVFNQFDAVAIETLTLEKLPLFSRQIATMISTIDMASKDELPQMTESGAGETLFSYFNHGRFPNSNDDKKSPVPLVLFGTHSDRSTLQSVRRGESVKCASIVDTGLASQPASHLIFQLVSPRAPLFCARTYFLRNSAEPYREAVNVNQSSVDDTSDIRLLHRLYKLLMEIVIEAVREYTETADADKTEAFVLRKVLKEAEEFSESSIRSYLENAGNMEYRLWASDTMGRLVPLSDKGYVLAMSLTLYNVPSTQHQGRTLGSIIFGESFVVSRIQTTAVGGAVGRVDYQYALLTGHIPRQVTWPVTCDVPASLVGSDTSPHAMLGGRVATPCLPVQLVVPEFEQYSLLEGNVSFHEDGLVLCTSRGEAAILPQTNLEAIHYYSGASVDGPTMLIIRCQPILGCSLPVSWLDTETRNVVCIIAPKSKTQKAFYNQVLPLWRNAWAIQIDLLVTLPDPPMTEAEPRRGLTSEPRRSLTSEPRRSLTSIYQHSEAMVAEAKKVEESSLWKASLNVTNLMRFLDHYSVSSVREFPVPVAVMTGTASVDDVDDDEDKDASDKLIISIITGLPGSHKEALCDSLTSTVKDQNRWVVLRQPDDVITQFDPSTLRQSLSSVLAAQRKRHLVLSKKHARILVCTTGYTDIVDVVRATLFHPDPDVVRGTRIGAVTTCVNPLTMFLDDKLTFPMLLEQCAVGFVNNIVFTDKTDAEKLSQAKVMMRCVNPGAVQMVADKGEGISSEDVDLILSDSSFTSHQMSLQRYMNQPVWDQLSSTRPAAQPKMESICLKFSKPLSRTNLQNQLKVLKSRLNPHPYHGNVYEIRGKVRFDDSGTLFSLMFSTLTGSFRTLASELQPTPPSAGQQNQTAVHKSHSHYITFAGCQLNEQFLKQWTRLCAQQPPRKVALVTKQSLSKNDIQRIHNSIRHDALPEGWFYNGAQYISLAGDRCDLHPSIDAAIDEYLITVNKTIDQKNRVIDTTVCVDLFD